MSVYTDTPVRSAPAQTAATFSTFIAQQLARLRRNLAEGAARNAERRRQRRALASLDPHLLLDIGLTEAERAREVRRIF